MENIAWKLIHSYFEDNPNNLVAHHLESYNEFFNNGIFNIFRENNPIRFVDGAREDEEETSGPHECFLYLGGKNGDKIYFGKPIIYDEDRSHYMYPNDARLRNMTYGMTIHYDVEVEFVSREESKERKGEMIEKKETMILEKIYLGRFPIMLQSNLCILKGLNREVRYNMGECRNDYGGYFIIDGKERVVMSQEKFADNMLYVRKNKKDDLYSFSSEIRSVSEDASKPIRTTAVKMVAPSLQYSNNQIVVDVPNVKKPVPLFILMRALGIISDKDIIGTCLLDMKKYSSYVDLFIPSIHDASTIFNQKTALEFIASFTKNETVDGVLDILMNFFLPHVGEKNFLDKAYFIGYMVSKLLKVLKQEEKPTDRDSFLFKRVELTGSLLYDLFREYYLIQKREITRKIDETMYFHRGEYKNNLQKLIDDNSNEFFKTRTVEAGFKKAFKGSWGAAENTKRLGVVQVLDRLSWFSCISHLRKIILPLDASAKVVGPRHLNSSQWGFIDPVDTPDGGHIGLHKHLSITTVVTSGTSAFPMIQWLRRNFPITLLQECRHDYLANNTKVFVNGNWIGVLEDPLPTINTIRLYKRNGLLPVFNSVRFDYNRNEIQIFTDAGRLMRPIYYVEKNQKPSFSREKVMERIKNGKITWQEIVAGFGEKNTPSYSFKKNKIYDFADLYGGEARTVENKMAFLEENESIVDYIDTSEEESALIAFQLEDLKKNDLYTHLEIDPSLLLGVMGNSIIFPEHNQFPRDVFSCGQSRQAVSVYHSNYLMRIDKMGVVLNYGQIPLVKSRYLEYINKEEQPYGINAIVAIMSYTGYNVEDAILINAGAVDRGIFRTTYFTSYESREESSKISGIDVNSVFADVAHSNKKVVGIKPGYDYSHLDKFGMIQENTQLNDATVVIGKLTSSNNQPDIATDASVFPKKGQMGFVDKSFLTEGEEGTKLAKVRVREERIPAIGDKMASRSGQKGTIGLIIPEEDMPFTADGVRPDLIINPHAIPSRMTIGQLVESILGKLCGFYGGFGDCTAFANKGSNLKTYGDILVKAGFHSSGNQMLHSGMTGEQLQADIYMGPTYYMRLKHMVKDKINYRARGPRTVLTRQTVQGRANDGGLRIGEMERDGILAHGASHFLNESYLTRGDEYYMAVCNKTGAVAIYNKAANLFMSPFVDGPVQFVKTNDGKMNLEKVTRLGRSFSLLRIPYSLKLLIQELQTMNVQMRIITEDNVDQLLSMSYSNSIIKMTNNDSEFKKTEIKTTNKENNNELKYFIKNYDRYLSILKEKTLQQNKKETRNIPIPSLDLPSSSPTESIPYAPQYSPVYEYVPDNSKIGENPESPVYYPNTPLGVQDEWTVGEPIQTKQPTMDFGEKELNEFYEGLTQANKDQITALRNPRDQKMILKKVKERYDVKRENREEMEKPKEKFQTTGILEIEEPTSQKEDQEQEKDKDDKESEYENNNTQEQRGGDIKKIVSFHL